MHCWVFARSETYQGRLRIAFHNAMVSEMMGNGLKESGNGLITYILGAWWEHSLAWGGMSAEVWSGK